MFSNSLSKASRSRYRSKRAVRRPMDLPTYIVTNWTKAKITFVCFGIGAIAMMTILPIMMLESTMSSKSDSHGAKHSLVSLHNLIHKSIEVEQEYKGRGKNLKEKGRHKIQEDRHVEIPDDPILDEQVPVLSKRKDKTIPRDRKNVTTPVKTFKKLKDTQQRKRESKKLPVVEPKTLKEPKFVVEPEKIVKNVVEGQMVKELQNVLEQKTVKEPRNVVDPERLNESKDIVEAETVKELSDVKEPKNVTELRMVKEPQNVTELRMVKERKNVTKLQIVNEPKNVTELQMVKEPKNVTKLQIVKEPKNVTELQMVKESKNVTELETVEDPKKLLQPEKIKQATKLMAEQLANNTASTGTVKRRQLARGVSGLPISKTPALVGAHPGHIQCDVDVDNLAYWNDPQGNLDRKFVSPFATSELRYLTFEPDMGGWNNIRMSMEIIFVLAAVTGRVLVLPPKSPFYLLGTGKENARSFGNFFPLENPDFARQVKIMTMEEFVEKEKHGILNFTDEEYEKIKPVADICIHTTNSPINCEVLYEHLRHVGFQPEMEGMKSCLIFDLNHFHSQDKNVSTDVRLRAERFCGKTRKHNYYDDTLHLPQLIHWNAGGHAYRLLNHFYTFLYFTNPKLDNYYKRFVRDFLHYNDNIYCAAGKIVRALNAEGKSWSSLHVRRGDLQFKQVKIPAEEWYNNTKEIWQKDEILFIATDERNKSFFDPIKQHHDLRFLDDYWDVANLKDLEPNFIGMVDTIVASHGRAFAGTWFSTFTGYINRMRGYLGHSMNNSWYSWLPRKDAMQEWRYPEGNTPAREWPLGWVAIDGDIWIEHEGVPLVEDVDQQ